MTLCRGRPKPSLSNSQSRWLMAPLARGRLSVLKPTSAPGFSGNTLQPPGLVAVTVSRQVGTVNSAIVRLIGPVLGLACLVACGSDRPLAGHTWRLERVVFRTAREAHGQARTREMGADSAVQVRLEMGEASGTRVAGTLVVTVPANRSTKTYEITATEAVTGDVTLSAPAGVVGVEPVTASALRRGHLLWIVGRGAKDDYYVDSLVFRRVASGDARRTSLTVAYRGDSALKSVEVAATLKSDLRNLVVAQEAYFADSVRYTNRVDHLVPHFHPSPGVQVEIGLIADGHWGRARQNGVECDIYVGSRRPADSRARREGEPRCSTDR